MPLTLLLGGARSGKSSLAVQAGARWNGPVCFLATAPALDDDMAHRIARHRRERPANWTTLEEALDLDGALRSVADDALVIIDCLTLWVSNMMFAGRDDADVRRVAESASAIAVARSSPVVAVSNEVGMGVHPETDLGRRYRDLLGWVNQAWAATATTSLLLVAGRAIELTDPWDHLETEPTGQP